MIEFKNEKDVNKIEHPGGFMGTKMPSEPLSFSRKLGFPELIFNEDPTHIKEFNTTNMKNDWSHH